MKNTMRVLVSGAVVLAVLSAGCRSRSRKAALSDEDVIKRFNQIYYVSGNIHDTKWMGVRLEQNPCDLWMMQEIIWDLKPDVIIETGTWFGGSALYYAMLMEYVNNAGKVITVDIKDYNSDALSRFPVYRKRVTFLKGDSVSPDTLKKIGELIGPKKKVMVTLDSMHTKDHVLKELKLYSELVSPGSYLVVQDTNIHGHPVHPGAPEGPMEALKEFLKSDDRFAIDKTRMKFLLTFHPDGFLKRIK